MWRNKFGGVCESHTIRGELHINERYLEVHVPKWHPPPSLHLGGQEFGVGVRLNYNFLGKKNWVSYTMQPNGMRHASNEGAKQFPLKITSSNPHAKWHEETDLWN